MYDFIARRVIYFIPTIILISLLSFFIIEAPPGDVVSAQAEQLRALYGDEGVEHIIQRMRARYQLDEPAYTRYISWVRGIITRGDFGHSLIQQRPVLDIMAARLPMTVFITFLTLIFTFVVSIPIGIYSAVKQYSAFDYSFTTIAFLGVSIPNFLLALVLMFFVYHYFGWSVGGLFSAEYAHASWSIGRVIDLLRHLLVPVIVIGTAGTAGNVRTIRGMMLDEMNKEYVQTARAKGLSERIVIWKHAFKIAILPTISTIGWLLPVLVSGETITAIVLDLPTTGPSLFNALLNMDMYLAGSYILLLSTLTVIGTLLSDILLAFIDPRIRYD